MFVHGKQTIAGLILLAILLVGCAATSQQSSSSAGRGEASTSSGRVWPQPEPLAVMLMPERFAIGSSAVQLAQVAVGLAMAAYIVIRTFISPKPDRPPVAPL